MTGGDGTAGRVRRYTDWLRRWAVARRERRADAGFAAEGLQRCRRGLQVFCAFALAMLIASAIDSWVGEPERFAVLLQIRLFGIAALILIFTAASTSPGVRDPRPLVLMFAAIMSATMHALAVETGGQTSPQYDRMNLVILGLAVFPTWSAGWTALGCGVVVAIYVLGTAISGGSAADPYVTQNFIRTLAASVVSVGAAAVREGSRWQAFRDRKAIDEADARRHESEERLRVLNAELEARVQARTRELQQSEQRFRTIFDSAPVGILTADRAGRILHANRALEKMLGWELGELRGQTLDALTADADRNRVRSAFAQLCAARSSELQVDRRYVARDGSVIRAHEALAVVNDAQGDFDYVLGMVEDVTERQRAEEQARQHQEHLAHVLRVSTLGEMAAELAHELNQPLGAIVNFANGTLLRLRARGIDPEIENAVTQIADEGMRAGEIIRRMREFVRQGTSRREASDLNHLVRQAAYLIEPDARGRGIPLCLALADELPPISVDRIQVEQVVLNLLRNAIDAIDADPRGNDEVLLQTAQDGGALTVTVRDTGIGAPPQAGGRIFEAFFTTKHGGLGMGLSISRSIVEAHGGRLWAADNPDRGMTFSFSLPLARDRDAAAA